MAVLVAFMQLPPQPHLKSLAGFAQVMQQGGQCCQQTNVLPGVPIVFIPLPQDVARGRVGGHRAKFIELAGIPYYPHQLAVVLAANPVASHCRIAPGGFFEQLTQGVQALLGNGRLPGAVTTPFGKLVKNSAGFGECTFGALRN